MNKNSIMTACLLIFLLLSSGCGSTKQLTSSPTSLPPIQPSTAPDQPTPSPNEGQIVQPAIPSEPIPIIYDDDGSPDGTTALLYLLSHPRAHLQAVNISYGEAYPSVYIQHIGRILDSFGILDLPLGYGQDSPPTGNYGFPEGLRQAANTFWGWPIPNAEKTYPAQPAPELMVSVIRQSPSPVTVFVSGPLTNLAKALRLDPGIVKNVAGVYIMGGAVYVPGNINDLDPYTKNVTAEWNIYGDPQAAREVFDSGLKIYLVPLDATNQVQVTNEDIGQWRRGGKIANFAADIYDSLLRNWGAQQAAIWDVMTAAIMLNPDLCVFKSLHLEVTTQQGNTSGQTVVSPDKEANASVCLEPDADKIRQNLIDVFANSLDRKIIVPTLAQTPMPVPTATPDNQILFEGFTNGLQAGWTWLNENPSRWSITPDGWLQIAGEDSSLLADGAQSNLLCRNAPEGDFQITLHLSANPVCDYQQATLYLYQDGNNYIAMNRGFCGPCGGNGLFMEYKFSGDAGAYQVITEDTEVFLRLTSQGKTIIGQYALEADDWQPFGKVGYYLDQPSICLGVSNVDSAGTHHDDLVGRFDFLKITRP